MANTEPHVDSAGGSGEVMDRWKTDNCESGGDRLSSRSTSLSRRLIGLAGVAALTVGGAGAVLLGASAAVAQSSIQSNAYTIGTVATGGLSFAASSTAVGATGVTYTIGFNLPTADSGSDVTLTGLPGTTTATSAIVTAGGVGSVQTFAPASGLVNTPSLSGGEQVSIVISGFTNTGTSGVPVTVGAEFGGSTFATATFTPTAATTSATGVTVAPATASYQGSVATFSSFTGLSGNILYLGLTGAKFNPTTSVSGEYTVTYEASGSTTQVTANVTASQVDATPTTAGSYWETLTLGSILSSTDTVNVVANGVTNGVAGTGYGVVTSTAPVASTTVGTTYSFALGNAMPAITLTVSPNNQAATDAVYGVSFTVPSNFVVGSDKLVTSFQDNNGASVGLGTGYAVFDTTNPAVNFASTTAATSAGIPLTGVAPGDSITVDYYGVTNSTYGTSVTASADLSASDTIASTSNSVNYSGPTTSTSGLNVTVSNTVVSGTATYTISGLIAGGTAVNNLGETIQLDFSNGTAAQTNLVLPSSSVNYTLTDLTNAASSGATAVTGTTSASNSGGPSSVNEATLTTTNAIAAGDKLQIVITGVQNPSAASTTEYVTVDGASTLPVTTVATSASASAPTAATTYPNGAFVQSGGQIDVIAGGVGFGIPTFNDYQQIATSDSSAVVSGSFPAGTAVRTGTLLKVLGSPAIYVVGTNGEAYPFSTPTEFTSDGYSAMSVVNVPSLGSLTVGSGTAPTAAVTTPDGALVQSGSTIYVYAGGKAFGIPTFADYQTIAAATGTQVVMGTVSNTAATSLTAGTLIQPIGAAGIWVSNGTSIYQFSTASQFASDGYNGANVVPVPNATGLAQA